MKSSKFKITVLCIFTILALVLSGCSDSESTYTNPSDPTDASDSDDSSDGNDDYLPAFLDDYKELVGVDDVKAIIDGQYPEDYPADKPYKIVEVAWGGTTESSKYVEGHIPGAIHLDTDELEAEVVTDFPIRLESDADANWKNTWNFFGYDRLIFLIENMGIAKDTVVLVYSHSSSAACRFIIALNALGVEDVRYIYGGYTAWIAMGYEGETELSEHNVWGNTRNELLFNDEDGNLDYGKFDTNYADSNFDMTDLNQISPWKVDSGITTPAHPEYIVDAAAVNVARQNPADSKVVAIRDYDEFFGLTSGYRYIIGKGEIDGAVWGYGTNMYRSEIKTLLDPLEIEDMWEDMDLTADKEIIFYCGTGWRVSLTWFYAHMLGYANVKIYDGGWYEWSEFLNPVDPTTYPVQNRPEE